jgi:predicted Zn-dependent peptidase
MYKKIELKNGLKILLVPDKSTQAVTVLVLAKVGSKYEHKDINGISHFLEHMFFKGTKKRPTPLSVAETLDKIGGNFNAFTGEEYTGYFAKVEKGQFELALDWVSDIYLNSLLPQKEVAKEKGVIIEELNMYLDNPMIYVQNLWKEVLYGDQPAGWRVIGNRETILGVNRKKLLSYRKKFYTGDNTLVCIAGNFDSNKAIKKTKNYFKNLEKSKDIKKPVVKEEQKNPMSLIHYKKTDQTHLCLGFRTFNLFHPQRFALELLAVALGGMMSSRLFTEVREKLGLSYYIATRTELDPDSGSLITRAGIDNNKVDKAVKAILEEYKKIRKLGIKEEELQKAKDYLKGKLSLNLETSDSLASFYSTQELLLDQALTPQEFLRKIYKVKKEDILKVAKDIFKSENLNLALIGPFKDKKRFDNLLKEF